MSLILVVDDEVDLRLLLCTLLGEAGYETISAADGADAIAMSLQHRPDLITLDIAMPTMDGYQTFEVLKADEATESIPVIMITAHGMNHDRARAMSLGARDFITKPYEPDEVALRVGWALEND